MIPSTHARNGTAAALSVEQAIEYGYPVFVAEAPADRALSALGVVAYGLPAGLSSLAPPETLRSAAVVLVHGSDDGERQRMHAHAEAFLKAKWVSVKVLEVPAPNAIAWTMTEPAPTKADLVHRENLTPVFSPPKPAKGGAVDWMVGYAEKHAELVVSSSRETFARVRLASGVLATFAIDDAAFAHWLVRMHRAEHKTIPPREAVKQAQETLAGIARESGHVQEVFLRVARVGDEVYVDLADETWRVVHIGQHGVRMLSDAPVPFWRSEVMKPMPLPVLCASDEDAVVALGHLRRFFRIASSNDAVLFTAWLVYLFSGVRPYPVVSMSGDQDSGKSTATDFAKRLVDPSAPRHLPLPRSHEDLMVLGRGRHLLSYDNLSHVPPWLSDAISSITTGGGFATRARYTNKGQSVIDLASPVLLNGIDDVVRRHDLGSRTLRIRFASIPPEGREPLRTLEAAFEEAIPSLLGGLFYAVSVALREAPNHAALPVPLPTRLMDYVAWGRATERLYNLHGGDAFDDAFRACFLNASRDAADDDPVVSALGLLLEAEGRWEGTARDLLHDLQSYLPVHMQMRSGYGPEKLAHHLRSMKPVFPFIGVTFSQWRETGKQRRRMMSFSLSL
ncbi:MAG: hypothetical protein LCH53_10395 [Bacteroidetes bacterium]|nr:hypothetical protein [Bacteroidota bacterium]